MSATKTPEYNVWKKMRDRCNNPKSHNFKWYGGKGVTVCKQWDSFAAFISDMGPRPTPAHSIDRIDPMQGYAKANCRWADKTTQNANKKKRWVVEHHGEVMFAVDLARKIGIDRGSIYRALKEGRIAGARIVTLYPHSAPKIPPNPSLSPLKFGSSSGYQHSDAA